MPATVRNQPRLGLSKGRDARSRPLQRVVRLRKLYPRNEVTLRKKRNYVYNSRTHGSTPEWHVIARRHVDGEISETDGCQPKRRIKKRKHDQDVNGAQSQTTGLKGFPVKSVDSEGDGAGHPEHHQERNGTE